MRAVLDSNVLISGLFWRGNPYRCILAAEAGMYELVLAEAILQEVQDKLVEKFDNSPEEAEVSVTGLRHQAFLATLSGQSGWILADPDDDKIVETALVGKADVIVTGDHHLLGLGTIEGIPVLSPRQFLEFLNRQEPEN